MESAEEILDAKESYNFLSMAEKRRVIIAMEKYHQSRLSELKERVETCMNASPNGSYIAAYSRVINIIEDMQS